MRSALNRFQLVLFVAIACGCSSDPPQQRSANPNGAAGGAGASAVPIGGAQASGGGMPSAAGASATTAGSGAVAEPVAGAAGSAAGSPTAGANGAGGGAAIKHFSGEYRACGSPAPDVALDELATGFKSPTFTISDPHDSKRLFVLEQDGNIVLVVGGQKKTLATLAVNNPVDKQERGLMSMAFHPQFGVGGEKRIYLSFTNGDAELCVSEFVLDGDTLDVSAPKPFVKVPHTNGANRHFGAMIAFGPDGYLYLSSGDSEGKDGYKYGQDKSAILSAMLRFDVEHPDLPVAGNMPGADPRVFHKGFRNPWRFSFDLGNGDMFLGDVGEDNEEINYNKAGAGPQNYLWPDKTGQGSLYHYPTVDGGERAAVVGGYVYRGDSMPNMKGRYFYGDFDRGDIFVLTYDGQKMCDQRRVLNLTKGTPVAFGQDADGELYVVSWSAAADNSLFKLREK